MEQVMDALRLLTNSHAESFKQCRRRCYWAYQRGIRRTTDAKPLRMGTAFHQALHCLKQGLGIDAAIDAARAFYAAIPDGYDEYDWEIERETVATLVVGYDWRWQSQPLNVIASEASFRAPLLNPESLAPSRLFEFAGVIDGIVNVGGVKTVLEHKLLTNDIGPDSDLWRRMQFDPQISGYVYAARRMGYEVDSVLYDVARKPTIKPTDVAVCDDLGARIVLDSNGQRVKTERGLWRQTGDAAKGYILQTRQMTPEEWAKKLTGDISERPDYYFARREIPRLDGDIADWQIEMWDLQKSLRDAERNDRWYRTVNFATCPHCAFFALCEQRYDPQTGTLPEGFQIVENVNPELGDDTL